MDTVRSCSGSSYHSSRKKLITSSRVAVALFRSEVRTSQALVAKQERLNSIEESLRELMAKKDTLEREL